jgi:hypothetical protein
MTCTFDHRTVGYVSDNRRNCAGRTTEACAYPWFYDPENAGYYGTSSFDDAFIVVPYPNLDEILGGYFGEGAMCARTKPNHGSNKQWADYTGSCYKMKCDEQNRVINAIGPESNAKTVTCTTNGTRMTVSGYRGDFECPDPNVICGLLQYQNSGVIKSKRSHANALTPLNETSLVPAAPSGLPPAQGSPIAAAAVVGGVVDRGCHVLLVCEAPQDAG